MHGHFQMWRLTIGAADADPAVPGGSSTTDSRMSVVTMPSCGDERLHAQSVSKNIPVGNAERIDATAGLRPADKNSREATT